MSTSYWIIFLFWSISSINLTRTQLLCCFLSTAVYKTMLQTSTSNELWHFDFDNMLNPRARVNSLRVCNNQVWIFRLFARVHLFIFKNYLRVESTTAAKTTLAVIIARWTLMTFEYELLQQLLQLYGYKVYKINFSCLWRLPP